VKRPLIACISELVHSESSEEASPGKKKSLQFKSGKEIFEKD
jgi:hypothetical protein